MRRLSLLLLLFLSSAALAQPVITGVSPRSGPVVGGTEVTISGSGFVSNAEVFIGGARAAIRSVTPTAIVAVTPARLPGGADVSVFGANMAATLQNAFTYEGSPTDAFTPILLPVFTQPVFGAFGSEFRSILRVTNKGNQELEMFGLDVPCVILCPPRDYLRLPVSIGPRTTLYPTANGTPGRWIYVPNAQAGQLSAYLRVTDISGIAQNFGTEVPLIRFDQFRNEAIILPEVPIHPSYRNMLRIYAMEPVQVTVTVGQTRHVVQLRAGGDIFEPAYAEFTNFPAPGSVPPRSSPYIPSTGVTVQPPPPPINFPFTSPRIWAFVTVTNNETQQITTVTENPR